MACGKSARCSIGRSRTCGPTSRRATCRYNALHDNGYPSIGCAPCTRAVEPGADPRSGRWWWENPDSRECGLQPRRRVIPLKVEPRRAAAARESDRVNAMDYFPIFLRLAGEPVLVVGGGEVAARKIDLLLRTSAKVRVVAPELVAGLAERAAAGEIVHVAGEFQPEHLDGMRLAIAATDKQSRSMRGSRTRPSGVTFR